MDFFFVFVFFHLVLLMSIRCTRCRLSPWSTGERPKSEPRRGASRCLERKNTLSSMQRNQPPFVVCCVLCELGDKSHVVFVLISRVFFYPARCWKDLSSGGGAFSWFLAIPPCSPLPPLPPLPFRLIRLYQCHECHIMREV